MTSYLDDFIAGGEVDAPPLIGPVRSTDEVMAETEHWYTTAQAADFFPGKNGRPSKSDQWIYWGMRNGRFTYPEDTELRVGDPVVHVSWRVDGPFNPRTKKFESLPFKGVITGIVPSSGSVLVDWNGDPGIEYRTVVESDQVLKLIEPWSVGKARRRRFSLPMIQDIALCWHRQGNFPQDAVRVVLKRIALASQDQPYRGVF